MSFEEVKKRACEWGEDLWSACVRADSKELSVWEMLVVFTLYCLLLIAFPTEPGDDLLRHLKAHTFRFDYHLMFPFSPGLPRFNPWLPFDVVAGEFHLLFGQDAYIPLQIGATALFAGGIFWLLKGASSANFRFILTLAAVTVCMPRILLARPTTFETGFFLLSLAASQEKRPRTWLHMLLGSLMATYYLFWIYLIPLVGYRRVYAVPLLAGLLGWGLYGGAEYFVVVRDLLTMTAHRGVEVAEATPIAYGVMAYAHCFAPVLLYWQKDKKRLWALGWFLLSNQIRYIEALVPIAISYARHWDVKLSQGLCLVLFIAMCFMRPNTKVDNSWKQLRNVVPAGSRVLFLEMGPMFKGVYANDRIEASPCMEAGWDRHDVVAAIQESRMDGKLDPQLNLARYDFVIEDNLKELPRGVTLEKVAGHYRVWKVRKDLWRRNEKADHSDALLERGDDSGEVHRKSPAFAG